MGDCPGTQVPDSRDQLCALNHRDIDRLGVQNKWGAPSRLGIHILGERNKRDFPPRLGIRLEDQNNGGVPRRLSIRSLGDPNNQDALSHLGIHSLGTRIIRMP